ncbi:hypothetical protein U9M48_044465 [Paspalum notatum var. saurae]|uniref:PGG domain-containing protein n=1 Tax=Paspalum notatum var. saurae TaxID=547442 RepID=A0AAQ3XHJ2_PASNO
MAEPRGAKVAAADRATAERRMISTMLMAASSGDSQKLRQGEILEARPSPAQEVAIDVPIAGGGHDEHALEVVITEKAGSALHVVAAAGDSQRYKDSATAIHGRAGHLLTARNRDGDTPLHCAARAGNSGMVAHLVGLARGAEEVRALVAARNARGETALHEAVRFGGVEMVGALMDAGRGLACVVAYDGTSPMYLACAMGRRGIARELHDRGDGLPDLQCYSGPEGQNALHAAVIHHKGIARWLLDWKPDLVNQRDIYGSTPMHFAASAADPSVQFTSFVFTASNFERHFVGSYLLPQTCLTEFYERVLKLPLPLLLKAAPHLAFQPDIHGSFPVHVAAAADSVVSIIVLLTRYPGCAGLRDAMGRTFLHVAVQKKRYHIVKFACHCARSFKPALNVQDKDGNTALHLAIMDGELDIFRCLVRNHNVKINLQNNEGNTPMDIALGKVQSGFYFGLTAPRRILGMLNFLDAKTANRRRDQIEEGSLNVDEKAESEKIKDFAQIVGIGSVLVATATFAAAFTMPGGVWTPGDAAGPAAAAAAASTGWYDTAAGAHQAQPPATAGTPVLVGKYAFDGFVISNTLAFICSTLATFSLVYCGVATVNIQRRFKLVSFSLALLLCAARSFCAAFAFSLYLLLAPMEHGTAVSACVMTSLVLLDGIWFLIASIHDTTVLLTRKTKTTLMKLGVGFVANVIYLFWPYIF